MRLKTEIWVQAYLRACAAAGAMAMLVRRGDGDAGAIYIKINRLDGTAEVFGPAPAGLDGADGDRLFVPCFAAGPVAEAKAEAYLASQKRFDSDLWLIEVEDRAGRHFLDGWLAET